jgi:hypothetical protein
VGRRNLTERNVKTGMLPNSSLQEHLLRERLRQRQREAEQERVLAGRPRTGDCDPWLDAWASSSPPSGHACNSLSSVIDRSLDTVGEVKGLCRKDVNMKQLRVSQVADQS